MKTCLRLAAKTKQQSLSTFSTESCTDFVYVIQEIDTHHRAAEES